MSTRSNIGILNTDGSCEIVYCHNDGYPKHQAPILLLFGEVEARHLLSLGDLSYLQPRLDPTGPHSFSSPEHETTIAYHRDRGEDLHPARTVLKIKAVEQEYCYLYDVANKQWIWSDGEREWDLLIDWDEK
jgi:hypothetical protein